MDQILAKAATAEQIPLAIDQITQLLHERHRIRPGADDDFNLRDMTEITKTLSSTSETMGMLLRIVAAISLVVGGVGIMNIMLVSVTERTREIGLRMAVGARSHHILRQFLVEAVVLVPRRRRDRHPLRAAGVRRSWCARQALADADVARRRSSSPWASPPAWASSSASTRPGRPRGWTRSKRCGTNRLTACGFAMSRFQVKMFNARMFNVQ